MLGLALQGLSQAKVQEIDDESILSQVMLLNFFSTSMPIFTGVAFVEYLSHQALLLKINPALIKGCRNSLLSVLVQSSSSSKEFHYTLNLKLRHPLRPLRRSHVPLLICDSTPASSFAFLYSCADPQPLYIMRNISSPASPAWACFPGDSRGSICLRMRKHRSVLVVRIFRIPRVVARKLSGSFKLQYSSTRDKMTSSFTCSLYTANQRALGGPFQTNALLYLTPMEDRRRRSNSICYVAFGMEREHLSAGHRFRSMYRTRNKKSDSVSQITGYTFTKNAFDFPSNQIEKIKRPCV